MSEIYVDTTLFQKELTSLINKHSQENGSNTPDFILASHLVHCLHTFNEVIHKREWYYGREFIDHTKTREI